MPNHNRLVRVSLEIGRLVETRHAAHLAVAENATGLTMALIGASY